MNVPENAVIGSLGYVNGSVVRGPLPPGEYEVHKTQMEWSCVIPAGCKGGDHKTPHYWVHKGDLRRVAT